MQLLCCLCFCTKYVTMTLLLSQMAEVDPETLLEWLLTGQGDERDMQLIALEQLCMLLLMSDNVDRCFERSVQLETRLSIYNFQEQTLKLL